MQPNRCYFRRIPGLAMLCIMYAALTVSCRITYDIKPFLEENYTLQPKPSVFHFDLLGNMIMLKVKTGQKDTSYNFLFDTGSFTIIDKELASGLGIRPEKKALISGAGGGVGLVGLARVPELTIGNTTVYNVGAGIVDMSDIGRIMGVPVDGIIGNNFFEDFTITWNYKDETFSIDTSATLLEDGLIFRFFQSTATSNAPRIKALVDSNHRLDMIFDTGFDGLISLPRKTIIELPYDTTRLIEAIGVMTGGLFGNSPADWLVKPGTLQIGPLELKDIVCTSNHMEVGLIGGSFLSMGETTINYPQQKLVIRPFDEFRPEQAYFGTGLHAVKTADGYFRITGLWPGSSSDMLGLEPGDLIIEVNGIPVNPKPAMWFWYMNRSKEIDPIMVKILRNGKDREFVIRKSYILRENNNEE